MAESKLCEYLEILTLIIPISEKELEEYFCQQPQQKVKVVFNSYEIIFSRRHLSQFSGYFRRQCQNGTKTISIMKQFQLEYFERVMACFMGSSLRMQKNKFYIYYPILHYLEIESMLSTLRDDVKGWPWHYRMQQISNIAHLYRDFEIYFAFIQKLRQSPFEPKKRDNIPSALGSKPKAQSEHYIDVGNEQEGEQVVVGNSQILAELRHLGKKVTSLNEKYEAQKTITNQCMKQIIVLKQKLAQKQQTNIQITKILKKKCELSAQLASQLCQKQSPIKRVGQKYQQLGKNIRNVEKESGENRDDVTSHIVPGHIFGQIVYPDANQNGKKNHSPKKPKNEPQYQKMDEEQLQQLYLPRMKFDQQPKSTPKHNLPKLCNFITGQGFNQHTLNLIYCRHKDPFISFGKPADLRKCSNLLFLLRTTTNQNIGGFVSVPLPSNENDQYILDPNAFLFSLTKNQKFPIKKKQAQQAIFISEKYLICFSNDLMIPHQCLKQPSSCQWPTSYKQSKNILSQSGPVWFVGGSQFRVESIQVYTIAKSEMGMEMIL